MGNKNTDKAQAFANDARLFVIRLANADGQVLGYAIAERLSFLDPAAAAGSFPGFTPGARSLDEAFRALLGAQATEGVSAEAAALPATLEPGGRGLTVGAPSGTRGAPSGPPRAESVRGAPSGPPDDDD